MIFALDRPAQHSPKDNLARTVPLGYFIVIP